MARTLVIGGTLFIGRTLVERLVARGDDVVIMHRGKDSPFGDRVSEIRCDRNDTAAVRKVLEHTAFDVVYDNVYDWERGTSAEQVSTAVSAVAAGGRLRRYVFTSSIAAYGPGSDFDESSPLVSGDRPDRYGLQKAETERALFRLHAEAGVGVTTLRPAFIYGPHNPLDREAFFWDRIRADRPIIIPEDGSRLMQWVHVADVARAAMQAADSEAANGHAYNLAGPPLTQVEYVQALARAAGREAQLVPVPRARIQAAGGDVFAPPLYFGLYLDVPPIVVRTDRMRTELGIEQIPFDEGLRETFQWYSQQRRPRPDFAWEDALLATAR